MTAKEMFKKLGYKKIVDTKYEIIYSSENEKKCFYKKIIFNKTKKEFCAWDINKEWQTSYAGSISIKLLKVINKQIEELNWE